MFGLFVGLKKHYEGVTLGSGTTFVTILMKDDIIHV